MILLTSTSDLVKLVTGSATNVDVHASWVDNNSGTITPGRTNTAVTTATTTTVLGSPGASTQRNLKTMTITNKDVANSNLVTVQHFDGTINVQIAQVTLLAGQTLMYESEQGWFIQDTGSTGTVARTLLTADRTYYVRTDGSDSNGGLTNTAGGAFLTWQHAIDVVHETLDLAGFNVIIQAGGASGTFTGAIAVNGPFVGEKPTYSAGIISHSSVQLIGDTTTPTNFLLQTSTSSSVVQVLLAGVLTIKGFQLKSTGGGHLLDAYYFGKIYVNGNMDFSSTTGHHIFARRSSYIDLNASVAYTISGGAGNHWRAANNSIVSAQSLTITLTGTPAFSVAFMTLSGLSDLVAGGSTFVGSATGQSYLIELNSAAIIGALAIPGNSAGVCITGGQFI